MPNLRYFVTILAAFNIFMLCRAFLRYFRFSRSGIPALNYCLALLFSGVLYSVLSMLCFFLPPGLFLEQCVILNFFLALLANTFFFLIVVNLVYPCDAALLKCQKLFFVIPLLAFFICLTNPWHGLLLDGLSKDADGFFYNADSGVIVACFSVYPAALAFLAILMVFISEKKGMIKESRIRWMLLLAACLSPMLSFAEAAFEPFRLIRLNMALMWLPVTIVCYVCFGYLLTARKMAIEIMADAYVVFDMRGQCVDINAAGKRFFETYLEKPVPSLPDLDVLWSGPRGRREDDGELEIELSARGENKYFLFNNFILSNSINRHCGTGYIIKEITNYVQKVSHFTSLAGEDPLTGAKNRRFFAGYAREKLAESAARKKALAVLALDLDLFKNVNDTCGHSAGDEVLKEFCRVCAANLRAEDPLFRFGGEEFLILWEGKEMSDGEQLAERIRKAVEAHTFRTNAGELRITVSIGGYSWKPRKEDSIDTCIKEADKNLYKAKEKGRNRVEFSWKAE